MHPTDGVSSVREVLIAGIWDWIRGTGQKLPQPAPYRVEDCADWWIAHCYAPIRPAETEQGAILARQALLRWLGMSAFQRTAVIAAILDDVVPYRGDSFARYMRIVEETLRMREIGPDKYRCESLRLRSALLSGDAR